MAELTPSQFGMTKQLVIRLALPHVALVLAAISYVVVGAYIFNYVDYLGSPAKSSLNLTEEKIRLANDIWNLTRTKAHRGQVDDRLRDYIGATYAIYQQNPKTLSEQESSFTRQQRSVFFTATTVTSIGYGNEAPTSTVGRLVCMVFVFFGLPLLLITIADLAKFCSWGVTRSYLEFLKLEQRIRRRIQKWRERGLRKFSTAESSEMRIAGSDEDIAEFLWIHLDKAMFVEVPFLLVYFLLLGYVAIGACYLSHTENWGFVESYYFTLISLLTIGFGDLVPQNDKYLILTLLYIFAGLVLSTTCMDVIGVHYINKIHYFGRQMEKRDPLIWLKLVQQRRMRAMKRRAMMQLFSTVTALHHLKIDPKKSSHPNDPKHKEEQQQQQIEVQASGEPLPPQPPKNFRVQQAFAQSILLTWDPPDILPPEGEPFWYTLTYKLRTPDRKLTAGTTIDFIRTTHYQVVNLRSFTFYEFQLSTTTRAGSSQCARTEEYTEPSTVPQNVKLEAIGKGSATLSWDSPKRNKGNQKMYFLHFAKEPAPDFGQWEVMFVGARKSFTVSDLNSEQKYFACISAGHNVGFTAISKSVNFATL